MLLENLLANLIGQLLPLPLAFWLASVIIFLCGVGLAWRDGFPNLLRVPVFPKQLVGFSVILLLAFLINRGYAFSDDYAYLPTTSLIATGDIPPHFPLNPQVSLEYHYFGLLFSSQIMRVADILVWNAVDLMKALYFALAIMLAGLWAQRFTRSQIAGFLSGLMVAFGSGTRWLLLLLPIGWLDRISASIHMLGSGIASGQNLGGALIGNWAAEGLGPLPIPFAFTNGVYPPGIFSMFGSNSLGPIMLTCILLLTFSRWRGWRGGFISACFIACLGLIRETTSVFWITSWAVMTGFWMLRNRSLRLPVNLRNWWLVIFGGSLVGLLQGGVLTSLLQRVLFTPERTAQQTIAFNFTPVPSLVSSHLGVLSLLNPAQLIVAICELGPLMLGFPLMAVWGVKALRSQRWFEAAIVINAFITLSVLFVHFSGSSGERNTSRMYEFMELLAITSVPLAWLWVKKKGEGVRTAVIGAGLLSCISGIVLLGISLPAIQRPVLSYFIDKLDVKMLNQYWNRLEPDAIVFDNMVFRAPTVLGRMTNTHVSWYERRPEIRPLLKSPDPTKLLADGFSYVYADRAFWDSLDPSIRKKYEAGCAQLVGEVNDDQGDFRRLLDIRSCR